MKLYAHPSAPRHQPFYSATVAPASAYALLHQLLAAYNEVLYTWWSPEALYLACFGDIATRPTRTGQLPAPSVITKRLQAIEDRLGYEIPELLEHLSPEELTTAAQVFRECPLPGFVAHVLSLERMLHRRLDEPCSKRLNDESHAKAAGLGRDYSARLAPRPETAPCACHQPDMVLPPLALTLPAPATAVRQSTTTPKPPGAALTAQALLYQVKRAQERRRLKRKRR